MQPLWILLLIASASSAAPNKVWKNVQCCNCFFVSNIQQLELSIWYHSFFRAIHSEPIFVWVSNFTLRSKHLLGRTFAGAPTSSLRTLNHGIMAILFLYQGSFLGNPNDHYLALFFSIPKSMTTAIQNKIVFFQAWGVWYVWAIWRSPSPGWQYLSFCAILWPDCSRLTALPRTSVWRRMLTKWYTTNHIRGMP